MQRELEVASGPRPVIEEITSLYSSRQVDPIRVNKIRIDMDLYDGGYELADGAFQPFLPMEEGEV